MPRSSPRTTAATYSCGSGTRSSARSFSPRLPTRDASYSQLSLLPPAPLRRDVPRATAAFVNPPRDLAGVGARLDAQLRREHPPVFIEGAFVKPAFHPRALRHQITTAGG